MASWNKSLQSDGELAVEAIRIGVGAYRTGGHKTVKALVLLAQHIRGVSERRIRGLFFREFTREVSRSERACIRFGVARALRAHADALDRESCRLRDLANDIDREEFEWGARSPLPAAQRFAA